MNQSLKLQETDCLPDDTKLWMEKVPKSLHSPYKVHTENDVKQIEIEKNSATTYHKLLKNRMFRLNSIRSAIEIDQKIQEFSSQFCQGIIIYISKVKVKIDFN